MSNDECGMTNESRHLEMMPPIYVHEYLLRSGVALNAASVRREFAGVLNCLKGG